MAHRRSFSSRAPRRGTFWGRSPADTTPTFIANNTAVLDSTSAISAAEGQTIVRIRGTIFIVSDQASSLEDQVGALGVAVVSEQAVAVGVGSVPTPYTDQDSDKWMLHQYFAARTSVDSAGADLSGPYQRFDFDSKAMRKMVLGDEMIFVVENGGVSAFLYFLTFSVLFKVA